MWTSMFDLDLSILEKMLRPIIVYVFLLVGLRLSGKRELAQLNPMDLIVLLTLSNTVQNAIIGPDNSVTGGLIGAATLLAVNYVVVRFLFSHPGFDRLVQGKPALLIDHGKVNDRDRQRELITPQELAAAAHRQGFRKLADVERAVLEPSGVISFVGKEPPATEAHHAELTTRLDAVDRQLAEIRTLVAGRN
jgi:uncharacterized membrane protein YcaP (DUF421 family)